MSLRLLFVPVLAGGILLAGCEDDDDIDGLPARFSAELAGASEVPPVTTNATGAASFEIDDDEIDFSLTTTGLENVTAAHIHGPADIGENATVIVPLFIAADEGAWDGSKTASFNEDDFAAGQSVLTMAELVALMRSGETYVNVHTTENPAGAIRGQIETN